MKPEHLERDNANSDLWAENLQYLANILGELDERSLNWKHLDADVYWARSAHLETALRNWLNYMDRDALRAAEHYDQKGLES